MGSESSEQKARLLLKLGVQQVDQLAEAMGGFRTKVDKASDSLLGFVPAYREGCRLEKELLEAVRLAEEAMQLSSSAVLDNEATP